MGRMFRIISEGFAQPNGHGPAVELLATPAPRPDDDWSPSGDVPFVEVGGPAGVVTSVPAQAKPAAKPAAPAKAKDDPKNDSRYLSVSFRHVPVLTLAGGISPDVVAFHLPDHAVSGEYRALADEIRDQLSAAGPKAVLFTSAVPNSGTTTVALNLAATLARDPDAAVLVVDAAVENPSAARKLAAADSPGLSDVLAQKVPLAWAVQPTPAARLHVLAAGDGGHASPDVGKLVEQLKQWFDWILIDGGTWGRRADREPLAAAADAAYAVARLTDLERPEFHALRTALPKVGKLKGYVTTRV
jgi:Mrp family chromosome partitioning ATPase